MYPSPERPDYGVFVARLADALRARGHDVEDVVLHAGARGPIATPRAYGRLTRQARAAVARHRPDVVYAHFLVPTGPRRDRDRDPVRDHGARLRRAQHAPQPGGRGADQAGAAAGGGGDLRLGLRGAAAGRARRRDGRGDRLRRRHRAPAAGPAGEGRVANGPRFLFVGSLTHRKNVERLLLAFAKLGGGTMTIVGGGPLEERLRAIAPVGTRFAGRLSSEGVAAEIAKADVVCLPSLEEAQGQAMLEALARGRPVVATRVGGPAEVLTPRIGALVDPLDVDSIAAGWWRPRRCRCRAARRCGWRRSTRCRSRPSGSRPCSPAPRPAAAPGSRKAGQSPNSGGAADRDAPARYGVGDDRVAGAGSGVRRRGRCRARRARAPPAAHDPDHARSAVTGPGRPGAVPAPGRVRAVLDAVLDVVARLPEPAGGGDGPPRGQGDRDRDRRRAAPVPAGDAGDADGALRRCRRGRAAALVAPPERAELVALFAELQEPVAAASAAKSLA